MTQPGPSMLGYVLAALLAAALSTVELPALWDRGRRSRPATALIAIRCMLNALTGALGYRFGFLAFGKLDWFLEPVPILVGGISGPALFRSQLALLGTGQENLRYGVANVYGKVQSLLDTRIDKALAEAETNWLLDDIIPVVCKKWTVDQLADRTITLLQQRKSLTDAQRKSKIRYVKDQASSATLKDSQKYKILIQFILQEAGRKSVTRLKDPP